MSLESPTVTLSSVDYNDFLIEFESKKPRLYMVRDFYFKGYKDIDNLRGLTQFYKIWRDTHEYGLIKNIKENRIFAVKLSKRGNDVYQRRVERRFGAFELPEGDIEFFPFTKYNPLVDVIFVTLTYNTSRCSRRDAWENIGKEFNVWISRLRKKYGRIEYVRNWESTERGYPHTHGCLIFKDHKFRAFKTLDEKLQFVWRLKAKKDLAKGYHSFIDVKAVRTYSSVIRYLRKRAVTGSEKNDDPGADLTLSLCWLFRKRAYAISKEFRLRVADLISKLHNYSLTQVTLEGLKVKEWEWLGIIEGSRLGLDPNIWCHELSKAELGYIQWL